MRRAITTTGFTPRNGLFTLGLILGGIWRHAPLTQNRSREIRSSGSPTRLMVYCGGYRCAHSTQDSTIGKFDCLGKKGVVLKTAGAKQMKDRELIDRRRFCDGRLVLLHCLDRDAADLMGRNK
ncbi:hypothetical protein [Bradyrhizobium sp. 170]|uniref:hypothetical protein n=1 Tax=Bradyrhizobium sp. 170 TaxID=2782641 RepID=UPI001FFED722|nr:hypothetical protein [Bradyrhizobium sp. 170]UPK00310.1 hypothetical protein IVB05_21310 [Bradyrhizobium sp. 170]